MVKTLQEVKVGSPARSQRPCRYKIRNMKLEVLEEGYYYHIYNKGINGTNVFENKENKLFFLKQFDKYLINKVSLLAYCLMDNHFHFLIQLNTNGKDVTQGFSNFLNSYAKAFNKQNNRTGSLFEKHFKRIKLDNEDYLRNLIIYIHLNPTHHLNVDYKNYTFSSYQAFISNKPTKLDRENVLELFFDKENFEFCHKTKGNLLEDKYLLE